MGQMIKSPTDLFLLLLYAKNKEKIVGTTKLTKLLFLLVQTEVFKKFATEFDFEGYKFGPWSTKIFDLYETLADIGLVDKEIIEQEGHENDFDQNKIGESNFYPEEKGISVYFLTKDGEKVAGVLYDRLTNEEKKALEKIKREFNNKRLGDLIEFVYKKYPIYTTKSIIKERVLPEKSAEKAFREKYPEIKIPSQFFKLVGILPKMSLEEEEEVLREIIRERYA